MSLPANANGNFAFSQATAQSTRGKAMGGRNGNGKGARAGDRMGLVENLAESRTLFPSWALSPPILVTPDLARVNRAGLAISLFPLISKHGEGG
jgi:hypothetical protein